jgi:hypothetical protein
MSVYVRALAGALAGSVLTFFACQIYYALRIPLPLRIGFIAVIAVVGIAGIAALLAPESEAAPRERLYTADEVAKLLAAVQAGTLVPAAPDTCKFCGQPQPDATGVDGARYHRRCFRAAYQSGKT